MQTKITIDGQLQGVPIVRLQDYGSVPEVVGEFEAMRTELDDLLDSHGALLFRGLKAIETAADFELLCQTDNDELRDYIGGTSPRKVEHGRVMQATETPPRWSIPLHQEMAYAEDLPAKITFFCERPASGAGGESCVGDMRLALNMIPDHIRRDFDRWGLELVRSLPSPDRLAEKPGVKKSWVEVFDTESKTEVDQIAASRNWNAEWKAGDTLQLSQGILDPVVTHPRTGESIWCNQAHFFSPATMIQWAVEDGRTDDANALIAAKETSIELLDFVRLGNGQPVSDEDALLIFEVLRNLERQLRLEAKDMLLLDNLAYAHGRRAFSGDRSILVVLSGHTVRK